MGSYNTAVITTVGQALLTSVLGAQGTMTFTKLQTSSYAYASGTDLSALTSLNNVEQEVSVTAGVIDSTHIYANALISNTGVSTEYSVNTLGIFASDGNSEVLFAVSTAETPDVIPVDSGGTPSTYKYKFNLAVSSTSDITISAVGNIDASDVDYDNSVSGLSATNVQGVIDEVVVEKASQRELSNLVLTGTTNTSGATISTGTCFVLNGDFVTAKADIASGATFTLNTNYEKKSVGSILTELNSKIPYYKQITVTGETNDFITSRTVTMTVPAELKGSISSNFAFLFRFYRRSWSNRGEVTFSGDAFSNGSELICYDGTNIGYIKFSDFSLVSDGIFSVTITASFSFVIEMFGVLINYNH
jgi:hypothetical protein